MDTQNVLINGELLVQKFPVELKRVTHKFLAYRFLNNFAQFGQVFADQINAVAYASSMCGHVIRIDTIERA